MNWISERLKYSIPWLIIAAAFVVSRMAYTHAGIVFFADIYKSGWHFIDAPLLEHDLFRSILYLHSQPPFLNLFTGLILQWFPENHNMVFQLTLLAFGFWLAISVYQLAQIFGFSNFTSTLLAVLFTTSPGAVLVESYLIYIVPVTALIVSSAIFLYKYIKTSSAFHGLIFFTLISAAALTWSLYHIIWVLLICIFVLHMTRSRKYKWVVMLPVLLVFGWYAKNLMLNGSFTASSWSGMNISRIATFRMSEEKKTTLVEKGVISELALLPPFRNASVYIKFFPDTPTTGIPVLDNFNTSVNGRNQNHLVYIQASKQYFKDAVILIALFPADYANSVEQAFYIYFHTLADYAIVAEENQKIETFSLWWARIFNGQKQMGASVGELLNQRSADYVAWWVVAGFIIAIVGGVRHIWNQRKHLALPENMLILYMVFNILYLTLVGNLMEIGENNRFRFTIDAFILLLALFQIKQISPFKQD